MVAEDFLQDPQIRGWLDGVEPAEVTDIRKSARTAARAVRRSDRDPDRCRTKALRRLHCFLIAASQG